MSLTKFEHSPQSSSFQTTPRTPSTDDSGDVDQFLSPSITSDSEETPPPSSPTTTHVNSDSLLSFDHNDSVFGDDPLLNESPFAWNEPGVFNVMTMFAVFLCFGLFLPAIGNSTYPVFTVTEDACVKITNELPPEVSFFKSNKHPTSRSLLNVGDQPLTSNPDSFNSSFTCPNAPLSVEDVLLDETNVKSSESRSYYSPYNRDKITNPPSSTSYRSSYTTYNTANASYDKETFSGVYIPPVRVRLLVES